MNFRQKLIESRDFLDIASWWQGKDSADQNEIDIVGIYVVDNKKALSYLLIRQSDGTEK